MKHTYSRCSLAQHQIKQLLVFSHKLHLIAANYFSIQRVHHHTAKKTSSHMITHSPRHRGSGATQLGLPVLQQKIFLTLP